MQGAPNRGEYDTRRSSFVEAHGGGACGQQVHGVSSAVAIANLGGRFLGVEPAARHFVAPTLERFGECFGKSARVARTAKHERNTRTEAATLLEQHDIVR